MRSRILPCLALAFSVPAIATIWAGSADRFSGLFAAFAAPTGLMQGCSDVPEAVALAEELSIRATRIERYMETITARNAQIAAADAELREKLAQLKALKDGIKARKDGKTADIRKDIDRLVAVYDQMKPSEAAAILTNLPSDFAAEILMRVKPETGARIIASVEPRQAALLTTEMGARSIRNK